MADKRFVVRHGLDNSGDTGVTKTIINVAEPVNNSDAATKYYVDTHVTGGTVTSVSATSPVESTGGTTPVISLGTGSNGQLVIGTGTGFTKSTLTAGSGVSISNSSGGITISATGSGGDVVGPSLATDNAVVRFDGTTGKLIQNSAVTLSDTGVLTVPEVSTTSITSTGNDPIVVAPAGTGDVHLNADSVRLGDNNADATLVTRGTGDLIITTNEGSATEGVIRLYDGANGNITLTPNGTGQVQVGSDQVVTLTASQTLTNKTLSTSSTWSGNTIGVAYGGTGATTLTSGSYVVGNGTSAVTLKTPTQVTADLDTFTYQIGGTAGKKGLVPAAPAIGASVVYLDQTGAWTSPNGSGTTTNALTISSPLTGTSFNGSTAVTIALGSGYGDTQNPYGSKTANYFLASPNGSAGVPTWRSIVAADIPTLNQNTTGTAANITATSNTTLTTLSSLVSIGTITTGTWNASAIGVAYGGTGLTSLTAGYIPYGNGTSAFGSSANLFWDSTNSRLGVGTSSPQAILSVGSGTIADTNIPIQMNASASGMAYIGFNNAGGYGLLVGYDNTVGYARIRNIANTPIAFSTNDVERMRIDATGLGIGTTTIGNRISVGVNTTNADGIVITNANNSAVAALVTAGTSGYGISGWANSAVLEAVPASTGGFVISAYTGNMIFQTGGRTERMRIDSSGNVGIGTSSPGAKLDVNGQVRAAYASGFQVDNAGTMLGKLYYSGGLILDRAASTSLFIAQNGSNQVTLDSSGNLGIGVTPSAWNASHRAIQFLYNTSISSYSSTDGLTLTSNGYADTATTWKYLETYSSAQYQVGAGQHIWYTAPSGTAGNAITWSERMRIDSSGNVGIGTASPAFRADFSDSGASITGTATIGSNMKGIRIYNTTTATTNNAIGLWFSTGPHQAGIASFRASADTTWETTLAFYTHVEGIASLNDATEKMRITGEGNVGIGNTSPSEKLNVTGKIKASDVLLGNNGTKGYGAITTTTSTSTPTGGASGDFTFIY
jgi:hypothetical protein